MKRSADRQLALITWSLEAAALHLYAFYLLDDASLPGYNERLVALYASASSLITRTITLNDQRLDFLNYSPFFCYQALLCAAFCVLKISCNTFFCEIVDAATGTHLLESTMVALRSMSIVNNDLPARLGDVIGFFCTLADHAAIGGHVADDLQLRQTRNRLSMSVVYDCLWTWRKSFHASKANQSGSNATNQDIEDKSQVNAHAFSFETD
jgi:transcriptional regulatory protein LEU3